MTQKHLSLHRYTACFLAVAVILLAAFSVFILEQGKTDASPKPQTTSTVQSVFSFTGAAGWWQGATNGTSMALFHRNTADSCFVSAEYHTGTVNVANELAQNEKAFESTGHAITPAGSQQLALRTSTGSVSYQLQQYSLANSAGTPDTVMGGQEFGYAQLLGGYIKLMGYCNTSNQLTATIPALQAFSFTAK